MGALSSRPKVYHAHDLDQLRAENVCPQGLVTCSSLDAESLASDGLPGDIVMENHQFHLCGR